VLAVATFEVHGDGRFDGGRDTLDDPLGELDRDGLAVAVALRLRHGPAAGRDRLCARLQNGVSGTRIPGIVQHEWRAFDVERREACGFFRLMHCVLLSARLRAVTGVTTSNAAWSGPSAVNSSLDDTDLSVSKYTDLSVACQGCLW